MIETLINFINVLVISHTILGLILMIVLSSAEEQITYPSLKALVLGIALIILMWLPLLYLGHLRLYVKNIEGKHSIRFSLDLYY